MACKSGGRSLAGGPTIEMGRESSGKAGGGGGGGGASSPPGLGYKTVGLRNTVCIIGHTVLETLAVCV